MSNHPLLMAAGQWFSPFSSTNKTDRLDEILLKVALNTITLTCNNNIHHGSRLY